MQRAHRSPSPPAAAGRSTRPPFDRNALFAQGHTLLHRALDRVHAHPYVTVLDHIGQRTCGSLADRLSAPPENPGETPVSFLYPVLTVVKVRIAFVSHILPRGFAHGSDTGRR